MRPRRRVGVPVLAFTVLALAAAAAAASSPGPVGTTVSVVRPAPLPSSLTISGLASPQDRVSRTFSSAAPRTSEPPLPAPEPVVVAAPVIGSLGIPESVLTAYRAAETTLTGESPECGLPWTLLAGIGRIESGHARGGAVDSDGNTVAPILGPVLDGGLAGNTVISDTDSGRHDGDTEHDRAVGPMQFIPGTWARYASDGNDDGVSDPQNIYDASLGAGRYLCSGGLDLRDPADEAAAVFRYNNSAAYVAEVLAWSAAYRAGTEATVDAQVEASPEASPPKTPEPTPAATADTADTPAPPAMPALVLPPLPVLPCVIFCTPPPA